MTIACQGLSLERIRRVLSKIIAQYGKIDKFSASLILEEAGGVVIDEVEKFPSISSNLIIASNKSIHEDLKKLVLSNIETTLKKRL